MHYHHMKRSYLLPEGCKDLNDVLKPKASGTELKKAPMPSPILQPIMIGEVLAAAPMTVRALAVLLNKKPFQIVADLMELRIVANTDQEIDFDLIAQVAWRYGQRVKRAA